MQGATTLATSGGPHPAAGMAALYLPHIYALFAPAAQGRPVEFANLQLDLAKALTASHAEMQDKFRAELKKSKPDFDALKPAIENQYASILAVIRKSPFAGALTDPNENEIANSLHELVFRSFATSLDIERKWHALKS